MAIDAGTRGLIIGDMKHGRDVAAIARDYHCSRMEFGTNFVRDLEMWFLRLNLPLVDILK